jgi:hypothetical protein
MKRVAVITVLLISSVMAKQIPLNSSKVCQKCHPIIYEEFQNSMHKNGSIFNDPVHKAIWDQHPLKKKEKYACKKCHTPVDTHLQGVPKKNEIQLHEPISCVYCHKIKDIRHHTKSNENILDTRGDVLFGARKAKKKSSDIKYKKEQSLFGLFTKHSGSPYHEIDFSNENFYNGKVCMGCHSHKRNKHNLAVCEMEFKPQENKQTCIECHMPKVEGSFSTIKESKLHRYHGFAGVSNGTEMLAKYVDIAIKPTKDGFDIHVTNLATHELFLHPMRLGVLRVHVYKKGKDIPLKSVYFVKVLGDDAKKIVPVWDATQVLKNTHLKPNETRVISYKISMQKGDSVEIELGFYKVNPKIAQKLQLQDKKLSSFRLLKKKEILWQ